MPAHVIRTPGQLGPILRSLRAVAGLTQTELAEQLGISRQAMSALERRPEKASFERLMRLWALLGLEVSLAKAPPSTAKAEW
ncbi:MAG TPA: helix-turn-helix transcriptional regulator [Stenotrophomonas sp.]